MQYTQLLNCFQNHVVITSRGTQPLNQFQENMQESRIPKFLGF